MFPGFTIEYVDAGDVQLRVCHGGTGPPVLLLHGHPRTLATWHQVAPLLARRFRVVCCDLRGYGQSSKPAEETDHSTYSKRAMAADGIAIMDHLGHHRFAIVGHDRGAYMAYRAALDFPQQVERVAVLDGVPIVEALERCDERFAREWWHWFFFAEPDKPERCAGAWVNWRGPIGSALSITLRPCTQCSKTTALVLPSTAITTHKTAPRDDASAVHC
jgi:haloacetate dehalogenase